MLVKVYPLIRIVVVYGLVDQSEHNNCLKSYLLALQPTLCGHNTCVVAANRDLYLVPVSGGLGLKELLKFLNMSAT